MKRIIFILFGVLLYANGVDVLTPVKYDKQKAKLGKLLYFDTRLSADKKVSCASCHSFEEGGANHKQFSIGVFKRVDSPMNSPTVYNAVFNCWQFWNGRAKTLAEQAGMAIMDEKEMGMNPKKLEKVVNSISEYKLMFKEIYNTDYISFANVCDAIAEFEKALVTLNSRFDRYLKGDKEALNSQEKRGYVLFKSYGCITCHNGKNFGGNSFQKLGIFAQYIKVPRGRDRYEVTHNPADKYVYKVPTLRNIALTAPYFHYGNVKTLEEAVLLMGKLNLGIKIPKKDIKDIVAFLKTLTGETPEILKE